MCRYIKNSYALQKKSPFPEIKEPKKGLEKNEKFIYGEERRNHSVGTMKVKKLE